MKNFPMQNITIYHKEGSNWERYIKEASFRNTSMLNKEKYGFSSSDKALIRVFDTEGYNNSIHLKNNSSTLNCPLNCFLGTTWKIQKGDIIVNGKVKDEINSSAVITELSNKYGKENIFKVNSINILIYEDEELKELNHVKIGAI